MSTRISTSLFARLMAPKDWVATFIAVVALATSVWSGIATRTYNRLASRSYVQITSKFSSSSDRLGLEVYNFGPGIAIIDEFNLSLDGTPLTGGWEEQWQQFRKATGTEDWTNRGGFQKGDTLAADATQSAQILIIVDESPFRNDRNYRHKWIRRGACLKEVVSRLTVRIRYHSVYGEGFEIQNEGFKPTRYCRRNWLGEYVEWRP